ncbi:MAG: hypothetical protein J5806_01270 [Lentisphaeria bacterium]|nr:hypothetical protein [Lentisphaeria bacterium]
MRKTAKFMTGLMAAGSILLLLLTAACETTRANSDRSLPELANHIVTRVGGVVEGKVFVVPVKAVDGVSLRIEGRDVFLYQYDPTKKKQKHKLDQIRKSGKLYINGIPFEAAVNGCFVMIEHQTNIKKKELLAAFQSF